MSQKKIKPKISKLKNSVESSHPAHDKELVRVKRIQGQVAGVERMIMDRRYCPEIMIQIRAARAALLALENAILRTHLQGCVAAAMKSNSQQMVETKIDEIIDLLK